MKNNTLIVAEVFYSIQGEGPYAGSPAVFLRLGGCNLLCEGAGWRCDSIEVWQKGKATKYKDVFSREQVKQMLSGAHLVITGGEPLLHQQQLQHFLLEYCYPKLNMDDVFIEVETNGTIVPLLQCVRHWNVSFKLSNSGESYDRRINQIALLTFIGMPVRKVIFKIVIGSVGDFLELANEFPHIPRSQLMLMPAGDTQEKLAVTRPIVAEICKQHCITYSDRLHIVLWNQKTGV